MVIFGKMQVPPIFMELPLEDQVIDDEDILNI